MYRCFDPLKFLFFFIRSHVILRICEEYFRLIRVKTKFNKKRGIINEKKIYIDYNSVCSPPVKWNRFTCGGGIFGFAKNNLEKEEFREESFDAAIAASSITYYFYGAVYLPYGAEINADSVFNAENQAQSVATVSITYSTRGTTSFPEKTVTNENLGNSYLTVVHYYSTLATTVSAISLDVVSIDDNYKFVGWYNTSSAMSYVNLLSTNENYSGSVPGDGMKFAAVFTLKTWDDCADESYARGTGTPISPYIIETAQQMAKVALDSRTSDLSGYYFKLGADIDMRDYLWDAISDFGGVFDGDMHTISGISTLESSKQGLFGTIKARSCTIKNLYLTNSVFYSSTNAGAFCAGVEGEKDDGACEYFRLQNCIAQNIILICTDENLHDSVGGLCGFVRCNDGLIENCMVDNCFISTINIANCSALVGAIINGTTIRNSCALNVEMRGSALQPVLPTTNVYDSGCSYYGTYVEFKKNGVMYREMKGTEAQLDEAFFYNPMLNHGYPIPRALSFFNDTSMGQGTYNWLISKKFKYMD